MLHIEEIKLIDNMLLVKEYPVEIPATNSNGVHLPDDVLAKMRASQRFRCGTVLSTGKMTHNPSDVNEGNLIMYPADRVDIFDIPVAYANNPLHRLERLVLLDVNTIFAKIERE